MHNVALTKGAAKYRIFRSIYITYLDGDRTVNDFIKKIPNILTIFRVACIPAVVYFIIMGNESVTNWVLAFVVLLLAGLSDYLDGKIARKYKVVSNFGKIMDPIADKLMQYAVLVSLYIYGVVPFIVLPIIFIKEILSGVGTLTLWTKLKMVKGASWYGKVYTVFFFAAIYITMTMNLVFYEDAKIAFTTGVLTTGGAIREYTISILMFLVALLGIWTLIMYARQYFKIHRRAIAEESKMPEGLTKAQQNKWIENYKAQQRTLKILAKQGK